MTTSRKTLLFITGSYPPMRCGVGDYTYHLVSRLRKRFETKVITSRHEAFQERSYIYTVAGWNIRSMAGAIRFILKTRPSLVHIQYPTIGYRNHLGPQFLACALRIFNFRTIVTLHEFTRAYWLRKMSVIPFLLSSSALIFTDENERLSISRVLPFLRKKMAKKGHIIPVGANILPSVTEMRRGSKNPSVVSFFGLFYPGRQMEVVVEAFKLASFSNPHLRFRFIGDMHPRHRNYFESVRMQIEKTFEKGRVEWVLSKPPPEVKSALETSDLCVLPYPDGASFRRTTLLTALSFGLPTISSKSQSTPAELVHYGNILFADSVSEMADHILELVKDTELYVRISRNAIDLSKRFSWENIESSHLAIYNRLD